MFTQVELKNQYKTIVYWLWQEDHYNAPLIRAGRGIKILEEEPYFTINRVFLSLKNLVDIPSEGRIGTVVEIN